MNETIFVLFVATLFYWFLLKLAYYLNEPKYSYEKDIYGKIIRVRIR